MQKKRRFGMKNVIASVLTAALVLTSTPSGILAGELLEVETEEMEGISPVEELAETAPAEGAEDALSLFGEDDADEAMFSVSEDVEAVEAVTESDVATGNEDATETVTEAALYYAETVAISAAAEQAIAGVVEGTVAKVVAREISLVNEEIDPEAEVTVTITTTEEEKAALAEAESLALVRVIDDAQAELVPAEKIVGEVTADGAQFLAGDSSVYAIVGTVSTTAENAELIADEEAVEAAEVEEIEAAQAEITTATVSGTPGTYYTYFTAGLAGANVTVAVPSLLGTSAAFMQASYVDAAEYEELISADNYGKVVEDVKAIEITFFDENGNVVKAGSVGAEIELASTGAETYVMYQQGKSSMKKAASSDVPYFSFNIKNGGTYVFAALAADGVDRAEGVTSRGITTFDLTTADGTSIQVSAPKAAFSGTTYLEAAEADADYTMVKASDALTENNEMLSDVVKAFDLSFHSAAGTEVEPARDVTVTVEAALDANGDYRLVQIKDDGTTEVLDEQQVSSNEASATFSADACFTYAITEVVTMVDYLTADGKTLKVTVTFDENEELPEDAQLVVREIREGDAEWFDRSVRLADVLNENYGNVTMSDARFLSISIMVDGKEYEPKSPVQVKIEYVDPFVTEDTIDYGYDEIFGGPIVPKEKENRFVAVHYTDAGADLIEAVNTSGTDGLAETVYVTDGFSDYDLVYMYDYDTYEPGDDYDPNARIHTVESVRALLGEGEVEAASAGQVPAHSKSLTDNQNGTYTIGLNVTGDADTDNTHASNVNVVMIYDVSTSMTYNQVPMATGGRGLDTSSATSYQDGTYFELYSLSGNNYTVINNDSYTGTVYRRSANRPYTYTEYTGQRYSRDIYRADAGEKILYDFVHALFGYQNADDHSNIQASVVTFAGSASTFQGWTDSEQDIVGTQNNPRMSWTGAANSRRMSYQNYTNWQAALQQAQDLLNNAPDRDPTYVVFITDGRPQTSGSTDAYQNYRDAADEAAAIENYCDGTGGAMYGIYAFGKEQDWLASLMYSAYNNQARPSSDIEGTTFDTEGYYKASDTEALTRAINEIFQRIVQTLGITDVAIADGTTSDVNTSTGVAHLLDVDTSSYQYWLTIPGLSAGSGGTYTFNMTSPKTGDNVEYTVTVNGGNVTITWKDPEDNSSKSATYAGRINAGNTMTIEWTQATSFYNFAPPAANFANSSVEWELHPVGTLLDGVQYTVTFDCYPSQETLDLIADLKNGDVKYNTLDPAIKQYLDEYYKLKTNTTATLYYTDNRTNNGRQEVTYNNPEPQPVNATEEIVVSKKWINTLDSREGWQQSLKLYVTRDGIQVHGVDLNENNNWTNTAWISYGIITEDTKGVHLKTTGHHYSFAEDIETGYYWVIKAPTVRPMLINNQVKLLQLLKQGTDTIPSEITGATGENAKAEVGGKTYYKLTIDEEVYYYVVIPDINAALTATNHRRSYLDVVKNITGNIIPEGDKFPFTMKVTNGNADTSATEDTHSDAWVWFSIWDTDANALLTDPDAATAQGLRWQLNDDPDNGTVVATKPVAADFNGYFCVPSGTSITVGMQSNYSLRFLNLPEGTEYVISEGTTMPKDGYSFVSIAGERGYDADGKEETTNDWTTETAGTVSGQSISGTIEYVESAYKVTVTNKFTGSFYVYHSSDNTIEKISTEDSRVDEEGKFNLVNETKANFLYGGYYKAYNGSSLTAEQIQKLSYDQDASADGIATEYDENHKGGFWAADNRGTRYSYDYIQNIVNTDANKVSWAWADAYTEESGDLMSPKINTVYYLKEVPDNYLTNYVYTIYHRQTRAMETLYEMTAIDDCNYLGFALDGTYAAPGTTAPASEVLTGAKFVKGIKFKSFTHDDGQVYGEWKTTSESYNTSQSSSGYTMENVFSPESIQEGYLAYWKWGYDGLKYPASFCPVWQTPDKVYVHGNYTGTLTVPANNVDQISLSKVRKN